MSRTTAPDPADALRRFNRFYTARIGALGGGHLGTPHSLTEARILFELGGHGPATSAGLAQTLEIDPAQVSRTVARLDRSGLVTRARSEADRRAHLLTLTTQGAREFRKLDTRSRTRAAHLLDPLPADRRVRLLAAMRAIEDVLSDAPVPAPAVVIRPHRPGDLGWVVSRHGAIYAEEYGWDSTFEALVAGVAKHFLEHFDAQREGCWVAEIDGRPVGSVCLVRKSATVAKLRLLFVESSARGQRIGTRLVDECLRFARRAGYKKVTLWTNSILDAARRLYEQAGFVRVKTSRPERVFGKELVFETWDLTLGPQP